MAQQQRPPINMKLGLAFSGGKDSWACLWLNQDKLHEITVLWINTGKNYPELLETIEYAKTVCPNFIEINTNQTAQNELEGIPSDVVPINWTRIGQEITGGKPIKIQSYLGCCYENISKHINGAAKHYGITHLIRGQRLEESHKSPARDKQQVDGLIYLQPIENWTKQQVMDYLDQKMSIPEHFKLNHSSMDCYDCTAYAKESTDRILFMKAKHPELYQAYKARKDQLNTALNEEMQWLN